MKPIAHEVSAQSESHDPCPREAERYPTAPAHFPRIQHKERIETNSRVTRWAFQVNPDRRWPAKKTLEISRRGNRPVPDPESHQVSQEGCHHDQRQHPVDERRRGSPERQVHVVVGLLPSHHTVPPPGRPWPQGSDWCSPPRLSPTRTAAENVWYTCQSAIPWWNPRWTIGKARHRIPNPATAARLRRVPRMSSQGMKNTGVSLIAVAATIHPLPATSRCWKGPDPEQTEDEDQQVHLDHVQIVQDEIGGKDPARTSGRWAARRVGSSRSDDVPWKCRLRRRPGRPSYVKSHAASFSGKRPNT